MLSGSVTRSELVKRVRGSLRHEGFDQIPQLECVAADKSMLALNARNLNKTKETERGKTTLA